MLKTMKRWLLFLWVLCASVSAADIGQAPLLFREDWTSSPPAIPLTQRDISNSQLKLDVHGPGALLIKKSFHDARDWDPHYVWSGLAQGSWAVSLSLADDGIMDLPSAASRSAVRRRELQLTGTATLRWRSHQSGFHELRAIVELENGDWLVSETSDRRPPPQANGTFLSWYSQIHVGDNSISSLLKKAPLSRKSLWIVFVPSALQIYELVAGAVPAPVWTGLRFTDNELPVDHYSCLSFPDNPIWLAGVAAWILRVLLASDITSACTCSRTTNGNH